MRNNTQPSIARAAVGLALSAGLLVGCSGGPTTLGTHERTGVGYAPRAVVLDGTLDEWPEDAGALADSDYIYFRFSPGYSAPACPQAAPEELTLLVDLDSNPDTGWGGAAPGALGGSLGVDLVVSFSPRTDDGPGHGAQIRTCTADGPGEPISHAAIDLAFAPTYAADEYELRLARDCEAYHALGLAMKSGSGVTGMFVLRDESGQIAGWSDPVPVTLSRSRVAGDEPDVAIPVKDVGSLRVVSYNVLRSGPVKTPERFARVLGVLDPDVIVLQEWTDADAEDIASWLDTNVARPEAWSVVRSAGWGVAIASRAEVAALGPAALRLDDALAEDPVRFVGATITTPLGPIAVAGTHLKCCGSAGSAEDGRRVEEARTINRALGEAIDWSRCAGLVVAGDFNLVGTREPLDEMRWEGDRDGSHLSVAEPFVLGDTASITWTDGSSAFTPGRLDYALYSRSSLDLVRTFTLDTRRLSDTTLAAYGLELDDSAASDHLPLVMDFRVNPGYVSASDD